MKLRSRLALISALMLILPLAGWQLVRTLEGSLRDSYQQTLIDTARSLAAEIATGEIELPESDGLFVHQAASAFVIDGHSDDWAAWRDEAQPLTSPESSEGGARVILADYRGRLHLLVEVDDDTLVLGGPDGRPGDHLIIEIDSAEGRRRLPIKPIAPGWLSLRDDHQEIRARAALQPRQRGWRMEVAIDQPDQISALDLRVVDIDRRTPSAPTAVHRTKGGSRPLIYPSRKLSQQLDARLPERTRAWLAHPHGWVLARADRQHIQPAEEAEHTSGWLLATTAARLLGVLPGEPPRRGSDRNRIELTDVGPQPGARWYQQPSGSGFVVSASAPVKRNGETLAHVLIERPADRFMARAYRSLLQLFVFGLAGMLIVAATLIGFAARLSSRIRRLRDTAESAIGRDGRVRSALPAPRHGDEIGDLGRSLSAMVERQREHQDYLQTLADKLSHELRTPLAMIRSSLENLSEVDDVESRDRYLQRAEQGCHRLQRMFQAMSQAARIEESLAAEALEKIDLGELVEQYVHGCRQTFAAHRFTARLPARGEAQINASAEQLAQLLDKLVENAVEFSAEGSRINLRVLARGDRISLQVDNPGPALPEGPSERIFESMVSSRSGGDGAHLGLGLHIVRLIARRHAASARAMDRPGGVRFEVNFPRSR